MIAGVGPASRQGYLWVMGQLSSSSKGFGAKTLNQHAYLDSSDLDPGGVPSLPFPALDTHSPQTQKGYSAIPFSQLDAISDLNYHMKMFIHYFLQVGLTLGEELSCEYSRSIQLRENGISGGE